MGGEMTPLLSWENYGVKLVLKGETFGSPRGQTQWFGNFSVFADHHEVIRVNVRTGAMKLGKEHKKLENQTLNTVEVFVDGNPVTGFGKVKSERGRDCSITAAKAGKYESNTARQVRWAHLNMKMRSSLPSDPSGLVAELAGFNPLSKKSKEHRLKMKGKKDEDEDEEQQ